MEQWTLENGVPSGEIGTFRPNLLFELSRGAKAAEAARNIYAVYGDNVIGDSTERKWFFRFKEDLLTLVTLHVQEDFRGSMEII